MIATLILYTAGRTIAAWINNNQLPIVPGKAFTYFGGYIYFIHIGSAATSNATGMEMNAIASSIIGGTLLTGGAGNVIGTLFGVLSLNTIRNIVSSIGLDDAWWTGITIAGMLCIFLIIQSVVMSRTRKK